MSRVKFLSTRECVDLIKSNSTVASIGFLMTGVAEEMLLELENRFLETSYPKNLTVIYASAIGDGVSRGMNHLAHDGLIKRVIAGHYGLTPKLGKMIYENKIEAYNFPQGVLVSLFRECAAKRPGIISSVGLGTFVDPDFDGGKLNSITTENLVEKIDFNGSDYLFYPTHKLDVAILRGTEVDEDGNIGNSMEALKLENLVIASAVKNNGGIVLVQVLKKVKNGEIAPKDISIPHTFVDAVAVVNDEKNHMMTIKTQFNKEFISYGHSDKSFERSPFDERMIIGRRAALEVENSDHVINYGFGVPEKVSEVLLNEKLSNKFVASVEPGVIGGFALGGGDFGSALNPTTIIDHNNQFDFYDGGGIDITFLGMAQCDVNGSLNVSKFGPKIPGCGGFINISQSAKKVIFCGTFTASGLKIDIVDGKVNIIQEGTHKKFVNSLEQITFNGTYESKKNKKILVVTERCVFQVTTKGLMLIEVAPGIDLNNDILAHMEFKPLISSDLKLMDSSIFYDDKLNIQI